MKAKLTATLIFLVLIPAAASARIIFWADFENGIPSDWTVVGSVPAWGTASNACLVTNYGSFWDDISGDFAAVNNLCENYGLGSFAALISNVVDLTHFSDAYIYFDHDFLLDNGVVSGDFSVSPSSAADADVIGTYNDTAVGDATESFDLSLLGYGDGNPFFYVGWEYWIGATAGSDPAGFWALDNVLLTADCAETWQDAALAEDSGAPSQNRGTISPNRLAVCITPSEYPSYLKEISVYTVNNTTNETAFFEVYLDPDGNGPPEGDPIWTGTNFTPASSTWTSQDLTGEAEFDVPIHAGSWCLAVGYNAATGYPFVGADPADPLLHSFKGTSGSWTTDPSGYRYYIRGVVESCLPATTTTTTTTTTSSSSTTTTTAPATTTTTDPGTTTTTTPGTTTTTAPGTTTTTAPGTTTTTVPGTTTTTAPTTTTTSTAPSTTTTSPATTTTTVVTTTSTTTTTAGGDDDTSDDDADDDFDDDTGDDDTGDDDSASDDDSTPFNPPTDDDDDEAGPATRSGSEDDNESGCCGG